MNIKKRIKEYTILTLGALLTALAFNLFLIGNKIAPGGLSGLATVIYHAVRIPAGDKFIRVPVGVTSLALNIPLFIIGVKSLGTGFGIKTLYSTIVLSFFIDIVKVPTMTTDPLLASIYGGVLMGVGLGLVFRQNATTGGTDLLAKIIHKFFSFIGIGWVLFVIDFLVVVTAGIVFGPNQAFYALISLFIGAKVIDLIQEGLNSAKALFIISDESKAISQDILKKMDRGATLLNGKGAYTMNEKNVILCVVSRVQITKVKSIVKNIDPYAFVLVADVREVMGEGFNEI